ncbi:flagellar hook assembly protein FlgD [Paenisporosarcina cavernae]|uniref:Basal-body rod modification protein FlgD n=1 Tax=Paenisporosarcina cavernae TaxID=2320858 RepID=A0A385YR54_9BACL|nr:flagellar hook assembly protein FlgD [Paenisporosarcina cavernae]AYC29245.1 flagellar hook assembly protein FlgD [Paenisporosarcina cavernae]
MANSQAINSNFYLSQVQQTRKTGNSALGKDEFLKILMAQLQNQDPTNPMKDNEFIAQMAQFSSLEQMTNMTKAFESFADGQQQMQLIQYNSFVGKEVTWHELTEEVTEDGKPVVNEGKGAIQSVKFVDGSVEFTLTDGKVINPGNISEVTSSSTSSNSLVEASMLIGKTVTYDKDGADTSSEVVSVTNKGGKLEYVLANGEKVNSSQFTTISE